MGTRRRLNVDARFREPLIVENSELRMSFVSIDAPAFIVDECIIASAPSIAASSESAASK